MNKAFNDAVDRLLEQAIAEERTRIIDELFKASVPVGRSERSISYYRAVSIVTKSGRD